MIEVPRTVPIGRRRIVLEALNAGEEDYARSVVGSHRQGRFQGASRLIPAPRPIGAETLRIVRAQRNLLCRQLARSSHDVKDSALHRVGVREVRPTFSTTSTQSGHWCDLDHTTYTQDLGNMYSSPRQLENRRLVFRAVIRTNFSFDNFG